jgi:hypothetical protein
LKKNCQIQKCDYQSQIESPKKDSKKLSQRDDAVSQAVSFACHQYYLGFYRYQIGVFEVVSACG